MNLNLIEMLLWDLKVLSINEYLEAMNWSNHVKKSFPKFLNDVTNC